MQHKKNLYGGGGRNAPILKRVKFLIVVIHFINYCSEAFKILFSSCQYLINPKNTVELPAYFFRSCTGSGYYVLLIFNNRGLLNSTYVAEVTLSKHCMYVCTYV